jgi:hypothetical protein
MDNRDVCPNKINRKHDKIDIVYLEKCLEHEKINFVNIKKRKTENEEDEIKKQDKIIWMEDYLQSLNKDIRLLKDEVAN